MEAPRPRPETTDLPNRPLSPPLYLTSVWQCADYDQALRSMAGSDYIYQRERHPNADQLADELARWHEAPRAVITASGMAALALAAVARLQQGDQVLLSDRLYGLTQQLWVEELSRWGVSATLADTHDPRAVAQAIQPGTRLVVVETLANPMLQVADLQALSDLAHQHGAELLVDNTLASPWLCRPRQWGADLVMESLTKMINGHSDVILGALCGSAVGWERVLSSLTSWGWTASPLPCWLTLRGMATLDVRMERACRNALQLAQALEEHPSVAEVFYPGLPHHPQHELAQRQFAGRFGSLVTCRLQDDQAARHFLASCGPAGLPFAPSLGEHQTTISHPASTSHRAVSEEQRRRLGITPSVLRISVGIESWQDLWSSVLRALPVA